MTSTWVRAGALTLLLVLAAPAAALAQSGTVEGIEVQGLVGMDRDAFLLRFGIKAGDSYDPARIRTQYRKLWDLGLFEDLTIFAEDAPNGGKVLVIKVKERRRLTGVSYEENKVLTKTAIEDGLKEKKVRLEPGQPLDLRKVADVEQVIRDLLGQKGYLDPTVRGRVDPQSESTAAVTFEIRPGGKTRIRDIEFTGNTVFSDSKLKQQLKLTQEWRWYWPWSSKNLYHPAKWDQDSGGIRTVYQNSGYIDVDLRPPVVDVKVVQDEKDAEKRRQKAEAAEAAAAEAAKPAAAPPTGLSAKELEKWYEAQRAREEKARKKADKARQEAEPGAKRWAYLTVRVVEGPQYRAGTVSVSGNTVLDERQIRARVPILEGAVLNAGLLDLAVQRIQRDYEDRGYAYATARREIVRRPGDEKIADVKIAVSEDQQYRVSRIEFTGNTSTQDRVLRREFRVVEGDLFSRSLLDLSVQKVNQLGYFELKKEDVLVEPVPGTNQVKITLPGEEKGRNEIQVGGGYSGLDGAFFQGFYSTKNFLGRGQIVSTSLQVGGRANRFRISFQEPWFLGRPYTLGFNIFRDDVDYGGSLTSTGKGWGIVLGRFLGNFTSLAVRYDYQEVESSNFTYTGQTARNIISSLTPAIQHNRVDNPYRPSRGWSISGDVQLAGGALGGDTSYIRPRLVYSAYRPLFRRTFLGVHAEAAMVREWRGGSSDNTANVYGVPQFERFWIGGDYLGPRGFETRGITPKRFVALDPFGRIIDVTADPTGSPSSSWYDRNLDGLLDNQDLVELGGDRYYVLQGEYVIPFSSPVEVALFLDVGDSLFEDTGWSFKYVRVSTGIEVRFYLPVFPVPLRLIYGVPLRKVEGDETSGFLFSIGRSF